MPRLRLLPPVTTVYTQEAAAAVLTYLMQRGGDIAIDTETNGLDIMRCKVLCWSMATEDRRYFLDKKFLPFFDPLFRRTDITWYYANAKFDMHMLSNMGCLPIGEAHDIIVMDAMDDDTRQHGLKAQARMAYDISWGDFKDLFLNPVQVAQVLGLDPSAFTQFGKMTMSEKFLFVWEQNPRIVENYASCDAYFTYMRAKDLSRELQATELPTDMVPGFNTLYDYFHIIEVPFTKVLWKMEREGVPVDLDIVQKLDGPMRDGLRKYELALREKISPTFNPHSGDELGAVLFGKESKFNLTPISYTSTGKPATPEKDLKLLQSRTKDQVAWNFLEDILQLRHLKKLHGTYVKNVRGMLGPDDRIHARINQTGTRTGRLSYADPNLQQIPIRKDEFKLRTMFVPPKGHLLLDCDYPQIQPRLAAVFSNETKMLEAILQGFDLHSANAANMYGIHDKSINYKLIEAAKNKKDARVEALNDTEKHLLKLREGAKTVGLGVLFGLGTRKMAHSLGITFEQAGELQATFFATYPNLAQFIQDTHDKCHDDEFASTMLGRIRRLHQVNNGMNFGREKAEERAGFNHVIQGSEMEVMKLAMLQIDACPMWHELGGKLALTVHDELVAFAPKGNEVEALELMKHYMADPLNWQMIQLKLPVSVDPDGGIGTSWAAAH